MVTSKAKSTVLTVNFAQFRMSMKSDKGETKPHHISIPQKDAIAIVPPKKVS
jgi:hypothetical protein